MFDAESMVKDFLSQKRIAVAGVSRTETNAPANVIYRKLRDTDYQVFAINPHAEVVEGDVCYKSLDSIQPPVDGVVIVTRPETTEEVVRQCAELGISRVWMHRSVGQGSVSEAAKQFCREHHIAVIPGGCPMMFCGPVDFGHRCLRWFLQLTGGLSK